jgi:hypothetical protein
MLNGNIIVNVVMSNTKAGYRRGAAIWSSHGGQHVSPSVLKQACSSPNPFATLVLIRGRFCRVRHRVAVLHEWRQGTASLKRSKPPSARRGMTVSHETTLFFSEKATRQASLMRRGERTVCRESSMSGVVLTHSHRLRRHGCCGHPSLEILGPPLTFSPS